MSVALAVEQDRALAPLTSLRLGGPARHFVCADSRALLLEALRWAEARSLPVGILGGGSNLIVGDAGFPGLVVKLALRGVALAREAEHTLVTVQAGEPWEEVVELSIAQGLAGIECLSGIPGSTGATPIQNVGAYGQEVSEVLDAVEVLDRDSGQLAWLPARDCGFGYRDSRFKRAPERHVVLAVRLRLRNDGVASIRYAELARALSATAAPSLRDVQQAVRSLRAGKGMLLDEHAPGSAGSFFTNPLLTLAEAEQVTRRALALGLVTRAEEVPRFAAGPEDRVKLSAAWLVERSGMAKGTRRGAVGISDRHALALVHHGSGTTAELLNLAHAIKGQVAALLGVTLQIEPVRWACEERA